ncbi:sn-glycerol-3-phosphate ABC transporter permease UgpA [Shumkonia mesophila]|uniref:sn-glycerol-3-phosphate ABC transporter permease UgpA n=1 Tax=Shumkonia mesophila TaxID=2838854 RepID=UPI002934F654|nr:sn-glycerol-3-phosphate ABC transporter permease UgpA [Shumkonia mesophila]
MEKRVVFQSRILPYLLLAPQIVVTLVFFIWPASQAVFQSVLQEDAFGLSTTFVGLENFEVLFTDSHYLSSFYVTVFFSTSVAVVAIACGLFLAVQADRVIHGATAYKTLLIWPYAVAPAVAGVLFLFLFNPNLGLFVFALRSLGYNWNHALNGEQAMSLVIVAAAWRQISYNFLFFLAGLQSIPKSLIEAAAIDGAQPVRRFWTIIFPMLTPTTFFLLIMNMVYAFFDTFAIIHQVTMGGPGGATNIMVYKVYRDGFVGLDLGGSAAQSVVLMIIVIGFTVIQFRYVERKVHY